MIANQTRSLSISADWCARAAAHPGLSPALLCQAVGTVATAGYRLVPHREAALETLINASLIAMGEPCLSLRSPTDVLDYRPECLNADQDLDAVVRGLQRDPRGRLCLIGPPGTGKTAFGAYVARKIKRPVLIKRASDLLSAFLARIAHQMIRLPASGAEYAVRCTLGRSPARCGLPPSPAEAQISPNQSAIVHEWRSIAGAKP